MGSSRREDPANAHHGGHPFEKAYYYYSVIIGIPIITGTIGAGAIGIGAIVCTKHHKGGFRTLGATCPGRESDVVDLRGLDRTCNIRGIYGVACVSPLSCFEPAARHAAWPEESGLRAIDRMAASIRAGRSGAGIRVEHDLSSYVWPAGWRATAILTYFLLSE
jgi:hypothetical protein